MAARTVSIEVRWRIQGTDAPWQVLTFPATANVITLPGVMRGEDYDGEARSIGDNGLASAWVPVSWTTPGANSGVAALPSASAGNVGSRWVAGAAVTYSTTDTSADISVSSGTLQVGATQVSYAASSATITGVADEVRKVYLYYDDPFFQGGTRTLGVTTDATTSVAANGRVLISELTVTFAATGGSGSGGGGIGGGGGGACVAVGMFVIERERGVILAGSVCVGDWLLRGNGTWGRVTVSQTRTVPGLRLVGDDLAALECSLTAPIQSGDGFILAPAMQGHHTPAFPGERLVMDTVQLGLIDVQHITLAADTDHDHVFRASADGQRWWAHHNVKGFDA